MKDKPYSCLLGLLLQRALLLHSAAVHHQPQAASGRMSVLGNKSHRKQLKLFRDPAQLFAMVRCTPS